MGMDTGLALYVIALLVEDGAYLNLFKQEVEENREKWDCQAKTDNSQGDLCVSWKWADFHFRLYYFAINGVAGS